MTRELFLFKLIYVAGPRRYCAYINHVMKYNDLKKFIEYWILKSHNLQYQPITFYWIDFDGDKFTVSNEDEYHIFEIKHPVNGVLWATSADIDYVLPQDRPNEGAWNQYFRHECGICFYCNQTNEYSYNECGLMRCVFCNFDRGHCCAYAVEGSLLPRFPLHTLLFDSTQYTYLSKKDEIVENDDTDNETSTASSAASLPIERMRSTGAIPKRIIKPVVKVEAYEMLPQHVENAVQVMLNMGFNNDNGWLTRLLLSTNGKISDALDMINPAPKLKRSTNYIPK